MTLSVNYGERFEIMEAVEPTDISIQSDKWVLVRVSAKVSYFFVCVICFVDNLY